MSIGFALITGVLESFFGPVRLGSMHTPATNPGPCECLQACHFQVGSNRIVIRQTY